MVKIVGYRHTVLSVNNTVPGNLQELSMVSFRQVSAFSITEKSGNPSGTHCGGFPDAPSLTDNSKYTVDSPKTCLKPKNLTISPLLIKFDNFPFMIHITNNKMWVLKEVIY